jgi:hypothetical protein
MSSTFRTIHRGLVLGAVLLSMIALHCRGQVTDPATLIQGVEMARLQVPPSRLYYHLVFREPLRKKESDHVMEFDGDKRRSLNQDPMPGGITARSLCYDGSQACDYLPSRNQASLRDIRDDSADPLFDARTLGLSALTWTESISQVLPYKDGTVEMVGAEQVRGVKTWHVRILVERAPRYTVDLWIADAERFPVYQYELRIGEETRRILSFYDDPSYPWLPSRVEFNSLVATNTFRLGLTFTLQRAEAHVSFPETNWTLSGLSLPVGTMVSDRRTKLTVGYWNGTNVTPFNKWTADYDISRRAQPVQQRSRLIVMSILCASILFPVLLVFWKISKKRA